MLCPPLEVHELVVHRRTQHLGVAIGELVVQTTEGSDLGRAHEGEILRPEEDHTPLAGVVVAGDGGEVVVRLLGVHLRQIAADDRSQVVGREFIADGPQSHDSPSRIR